MIDKTLIPEIPKYKKKSNKRGLSRSKHKHIYKQVIIKYPPLSNSFNEPHWALGGICETCGLISGNPDKVWKGNEDYNKFYNGIYWNGKDEETIKPWISEEKYEVYEAKELFDKFPKKVRTNDDI